MSPPINLNQTSPPAVPVARMLRSLLPEHSEHSFVINGPVEKVSVRKHEPPICKGHLWCLPLDGDWHANMKIPIVETGPSQQWCRRLSALGYLWLNKLNPRFASRHYRELEEVMKE